MVNSGNISGSNGVWIEGSAGTVSNLSGGTIQGTSGAIVINGVAGTVTNAGTITSSNQAVGLNGGGTLTNMAGGLIQGHGEANAVSAILGTSRTVINSGTIQSNDTGFGTGVSLQDGTLTNNVGGKILGAYNGVWANGSNVTSITNAGLIEAALAQGFGSGIEVDAGGTIVNSGTIRATTSTLNKTDAGIQFSGAGTITNSGTIASLDGGLAILFQGGGTHTLVLDLGSVLTGNVQGGSGTDALVLKGTGSEAISKFLELRDPVDAGGQLDPDRQRCLHHQRPGAKRCFAGERSAHQSRPIGSLRRHAGRRRHRHRRGHGRERRYRCARQFDRRAPYHRPGEL